MIHVVGIDFKHAGWNYLWDILADAEENGIPHKKINWVHGAYKDAEEALGFIYLDMHPVISDPSISSVGTKRPFIQLAEDVSDDEIVDKIQWLARSIFEPPDDNVVKEEPKVELRLEDSIDEVQTKTELKDSDMEGCSFNAVQVSIEGKPINLNKKDLVTLQKIQNLISQYGYSIEKVIV